MPSSDFKTQAKDLENNKSLLYKRIKLKEKIENSKFNLTTMHRDLGYGPNPELSNINVNAQPYDYQVLKYKINSLENDLEKYNKVSAKELNNFETNVETMFPEILKQHAEIQYRQHLKFGHELKQIISQLD